ncbi:ABC transporter substrate-binding protein [Paenibacillus darwinianus]|uniref:ABC transporter substrate-binding protein n=1 Tax=Paenibacillus darwinianus TaxID=1380763 RepID=A0A9W5W6V4_9BACL|nr:extracellular solute-binding protein [Paenibacillus darwinianus]EXX86760.1 ABC transporter substrate-binding protein [Paenibacillus darwinianus]EXX87072.1 ABC transporter substrate-binding protein [Paenibacillus darwinianus]EXX87290.1 ABC transporter substrate-binding protein [Paenibacillus darwinianus]
MKKRRTLSLIAAATLTVVLTACGGNSGGNAGTGGSESGASGAAANAGGTKENVTITFQTLQTDKSTPQYQVEEEIANNYMKENPNVKIEWDRLDIEQQKVKLKTQAASGEVSDITMVNPGAQLQPFADGKVLAPLNDMLDDELKGTFLEGVLDYYTFDGNVYALPYNMNIAGIYYNKELFEKAGVQPPATYEDIIASIPKFKEAGIPAMMVAGKDRWPLSFMFTNILQRVNGGPKFLDEVVAGNKQFTDPVFVEAIQKLQDLIKAGAYQEGAATYDYNTTSQQFRDGQGAMYYMGTWEVSAIDASEAVKGKIGFLPFPSVGGKGGAGDYVIAPGTAYALGANSENLDESKKFLKYLLMNYPKVAFEKKAAVGLAQKVDGDMKAAGYSQLAIDVMALFNQVKGGDMNFDNVIEPATTQVHLNGLQSLLVDDGVKAEELAQQHQTSWEASKK